MSMRRKIQFKDGEIIGIVENGHRWQYKVETQLGDVNRYILNKMFNADKDDVSEDITFIVLPTKRELMADDL